MVYEMLPAIFKWPGASTVKKQENQIWFESGRTAVLSVVIFVMVTVFTVLVFCTYNCILSVRNINFCR